MKDIEYVLPGDIEKRSFEIIEEELKARGISLDPVQDPITRRVIHTTADFEYVNSLTFSEGAVEKARELLSRGATIVTDTNMALSGINKASLNKLGCRAICFMADPVIAAQAKELGVTRASLSMQRAASLEGPVIFAVGNAPTALIQLYEMMEKGEFTPDFIIGVPVGFVNVEAAKELFIDSKVPYIINRGRKGGSNVAAAICNALMYGLYRE